MAISTNYNVSTMAQGNGVLDTPDVRKPRDTPNNERIQENNAPVTQTPSSNVSLSAQGRDLAYGPTTTVNPTTIAPQTESSPQRSAPPVSEEVKPASYSMKGQINAYDDERPKNTFSVSA